MSSFDILFIAISIAILSPFILILLMILGLVILFIESIISATILVIWEFVIKLFKRIKKYIK